MEFKGTKGSWEIDKDEEMVLTDIGGYRPNALQKLNSFKTELKANAQLIAAAPDLLKALQLMVNNFEDYQKETGAKNQAIFKAKSAINKALGL